MVKGVVEVSNLRDYYYRKENVIQLGLFIEFTILTGGHTFEFLEIADEGITVDKAICFCDLLNALPASGEVIFCVFNTDFCNICCEGNAVLSLKQQRDIVWGVLKFFVKNSGR